MGYKGTIVSISVTAAKVTVMLKREKESGTVTLTTSNIIIDEALVSAFVSGATVTIDAQSVGEIERVEAFGRGQFGSTSGKYTVNRLATPPMKVPDHLEVFLLNKQNTETAFNVFDRLMDPLFVAAFVVPPSPVSEIRLDIEYDGSTVTAVKSTRP